MPHGATDDADIGDDLITSSTAAKILNLAESTIRLWRRNGKLPPVGVTATGTAIYRRAAVERKRRELERRG